MSDEEFKLIVICLGLGGGMIWNAIRKNRRIRLVTDTPRSKTATAPQGFVEFEGFAWPTDQTIVTNKGLEAVYYSFKLQRQESTGSGKNRRKHWVTIYEFYHRPLFYLADATGLVTIDPTNAELNLNTAVTRGWRSIPKSDQERLLGLIDKDVPGFPPSSGLFGFFAGPYRVIESDLPVGCPLYASGDFRSVTGEHLKVKAGGMTDFAQKVFSASARGLKNVAHILDKNGDGKVSAEEAHAGYTDAARIARAKVKLAGYVEQEFDLHGSLGNSSSHALFLADTTEEHLKSRLQKWLWLQFLLGAAGVTAGIALAIGTTVGQMPWTKSQPAVARNAASVPGADWKAKVPELHAACTTGDSHACVTLLSHRDELQLSPKYIDFYKLNLESAKLRHAK